MAKKKNVIQEQPHQIIFPKTQVDDITGALLLIDYLYHSNLINKETYNSIQQKYNPNQSIKFFDEYS